MKLATGGKEVDRLTPVTVIVTSVVLRASRVVTFPNISSVSPNRYTALLLPVRGGKNDCAREDQQKFCKQKGKRKRLLK
jgi:hypothetical protein